MKLHKYIVMKDGVPLDFVCNSVRVDFSGSLVLQVVSGPLEITQETTAIAIFARESWQAIFLVNTENEDE